MKTNKLFPFIYIICSPVLLNSCNNQVIENTLAPNVEIESPIKKGIGVSRYNNRTQIAGNKINDLNVGWYYNWGIDDPSTHYINSEYVPMIWGASSVNENNLNKIKQGYERGIYKHLLTFNEPDNNSQSNMTVEQAIALWPQLEALGIPLSSPCPADYSSGWLDEFMEQAKKLNYRVDFIAVHCYQDFSINGIENKMKNDVLDVIYEKYKLPIWLTEYGAIDISVWAGGGKHNVNCTEKAAKTYIEKSTKLLEKIGYVERYAWFVDNFNEKGDSRPSEAPYTSLYNDDDTISSTGKIYRDIESNKPLYITTTNLPKIESSKDIDITITAKGGKGEYSFTSNNLPNGLSLNTNGNLTGKLNKGEYRIKFTVTDQNKQSTYKYLTLKVD